MRDELLDDIRPRGPLEKSAAEHNQPIQHGLGSFCNLMLLARSRERAYKQFKELRTEREMRDGPYKRKSHDVLARCELVMSYKRRLLEYDHFRGVLPAFAEEKPIPQNEPDNGMEPPPGTPLPGMDLPKRGLDFNPLER